VELLLRRGSAEGKAAGVRVLEVALTLGDNNNRAATTPTLTFSEHSENIQRTFREHLVKPKGSPRMCPVRGTGGHPGKYDE
jgi:hypothetical protein